MANIVRLQKILVLVFGVMLFLSNAKVVYAQSFWSIYDEEEERDQKPAVSPDINQESGDVSAWVTSTPAVSEEKPDIPDQGGFLSDADSQDNLIQDSNQNQKVSEKVFDPLFATGMFIAPVLGISGLQDPFTVSVKAGCEFIDTSVISPFFLGGGILMELGFPKEDFPYQYKVAGSAINSPNLLAATLYAPLGIMYGPFENKRIQLEMAARLGLKLLGFVSFDSGASSKVHCAFYTAMLIGVDVYNVHANVDVSYDSVGGFSPGLTLSYRFKIGNKRRKL